MIKPYTTYTRKNSDLIIDVLKIVYISEDKGYVKFKGTLKHKKYGYVYETKNYKLPINVVNTWKIHR